MLREEEAVQERIDAQQPVARQRDPLRAQLSEEPFRLQRGQLRVEAAQRIDAVFVVKIPWTDAAALQLQDELADQALIAAWPIGTPERQLARFDRRRSTVPRCRDSGDGRR